jgi:hypothetical protein
MEGVALLEEFTNAGLAGAEIVDRKQNPPSSSPYVEVAEVVATR